MFHNFFEKRAVCELMWKNIVEADRPQMTIWRMRIACCVPKATNPYSECIIFIAFPLQQWLHKRASMLRYTYNVCLFSDYFDFPSSVSFDNSFTLIFVIKLLISEGKAGETWKLSIKARIFPICGSISL